MYSITKKSVRILGIAPYEGMKTIMQRLAKSRTDICLDVYVGDLNKGLEIAKRNYCMNYDIIISRGGTAELIEQTLNIPVIEVTLSVYDILRAMKLAENYSGRYAIVGFTGITGNAHLLCDLLQYKIDIFTLHSQDEVFDTLTKLKKTGYSMVLGDMITNTIAKQIGLNTILITSGAESISSAIDQAVRLNHSYSSIREENLFWKNVIRCQASQTVIIKPDGEIFFSTLEQDLLNDILEILKDELSPVLSNNTHKFFKNINGALFSFDCHSISFMNEQYAVFCFSSSPVPFATSKYEIQYSNVREAEELLFNSFYSITGSANSMQATIENINQTRFPIMLSGEAGSGKEPVVQAIYSRSQLRNNPLITINCSLINDRSWNFITNHYNSPFNDNNNTICIQDISALPDNRRHQLLSIIVDTNLCKRNRIIFSCTCSCNQKLPTEAVEFVNLLSCVTLHLSPLRERVHEIPTLSSLYLNSINVSMANQIIGFEPEALKLLQEYDWPYNYTQFKRILNELSLVTTTPYIQTAHVKALLDKEFSLSGSSSNTATKNSPQIPDHAPAIDLNRSLNEITHDIIRHVLNETNGNQSAAAKRLGISRTTLWRYLQ